MVKYPISVKDKAEVALGTWSTKAFSPNNAPLCTSIRGFPYTSWKIS